MGGDKQDKKSKKDIKNKDMNKPTKEKHNKKHKNDKLAKTKSSAPKTHLSKNATVRNSSIHSNTDSPENVNKMQVMIVNLKQKCQNYDQALVNRQSELEVLQKQVSTNRVEKEHELNRLRSFYNNEKNKLSGQVDSFQRQLSILEKKNKASVEFLEEQEKAKTEAHRKSQQSVQKETQLARKQAEQLKIEYEKEIGNFQRQLSFLENEKKQSIVLLDTQEKALEHEKMEAQQIYELEAGKARQLAEDFEKKYDQAKGVSADLMKLNEDLDGRCKLLLDGVFEAELDKIASEISFDALFTANNDAKILKQTTKYPEKVLETAEPVLTFKKVPFSVIRSNPSIFEILGERNNTVVLIDSNVMTDPVEEFLKMDYKTLHISRSPEISRILGQLKPATEVEFPAEIATQTDNFSRPNSTVSNTSTVSSSNSENEHYLNLIEKLQMRALIDRPQLLYETTFLQFDTFDAFSRHDHLNNKINLLQKMVRVKSNAEREIVRLKSNADRQMIRSTR